MEYPSKYKFLITVLILLPFVIWLLIPLKLFENTPAWVLYDSEGYLIDAAVAEDGQWRLPMPDSIEIPQKYITCLLTFEDKRFYRHNGVDWLALMRAFKQNISSGSVVSGGSTVSMQVIRMSRKGKPRNVWQKLIEICLAEKLELHKSKRKILRLYAANAPYGGNIVGLQSASQRYFGRNPSDLTWSEAALLAVLPNAPSSIHLNRNREMLLEKRNNLLKKLYEEGKLLEMDYQLAIEEEIPEKLKPFPHEATHLLMRLKNEYPNQHIFYTKLKREHQNFANDILESHQNELRKNGINNAACIIADVRSGNVLAYVGNTGVFSNHGEHSFVDVASAPRSTGSILKPFLYAYALSKGEFLPNTLVPDIPKRYGDFSPRNFNLGYDGAVPASKIIVHSLNIPAVNMLEEHSVPVFLEDLHDLKIPSINRSADDYGLSLILGGAEARLDELTAAYASMGRRLLHYTEDNAVYYESDIHALQFLYDDTVKKAFPLSDAKLTASGIWFTFEAMKDLKRPTEQGNWEYFNSTQAIAWKTGTSFGFRDAWAIGVTPDYVVGVWVGNADGEGRPKLVGVKAAAPVLFELFDRLPHYNQWFACPWDDMIQMPVCEKSGYFASPFCESSDSVWVSASAYHFSQCPYHQLVYLDESGKYRVSRSCYSAENMQAYKAFVLPPAMEWYYKQKNPWYQGVPPMHPDCISQGERPMQIVYPDDQLRIYLPVDLNEERQAVVFEAAHHDEKAIIYWHIDDKYIATTKGFHQISVKPDKGKHILSIVDKSGNTIKHRFEILDER